MTDAHRSPYFNMVVNNKGYSSLAIRPKGTVVRRQDSPAVFDMTTVAYVAYVDFIKKSNGIFDGRVKSVHIPIERAIDIDNPIDFKIAECLINNIKDNENY